MLALSKIWFPAQSGAFLPAEVVLPPHALFAFGVPVVLSRCDSCVTCGLSPFEVWAGTIRGALVSTFGTGSNACPQYKDFADGATIISEAPTCLLGLRGSRIFLRRASQRNGFPYLVLDLRQVFHSSMLQPMLPTHATPDSEDVVLKLKTMCPHGYPTTHAKMEDIGHVLCMMGMMVCSL